MTALSADETHDPLANTVRIAKLGISRMCASTPRRVTSFPPDRTFTTEARWNPA